MKGRKVKRTPVVTPEEVKNQEVQNEESALREKVKDIIQQMELNNNFIRMQWRKLIVDLYNQIFDRNLSACCDNIIRDAYRNLRAWYYKNYDSLDY